MKNTEGTLVYLWCGQTVARSVYGYLITNFSRMGRLPHFLTHGAPLRAFLARELRKNNNNNNNTPVFFISKKMVCVLL